MDYERAKTYLKQLNQSHLLRYYDELDEDKRKILLDEIEKLNFSVVENIDKSCADVNDSLIEPFNATELPTIEKNYEKYKSEGLKLLANNKVAAVLLAGGQGTRLGFGKPKGMFNIGEARTLYIFEILLNTAKTVCELSKNYFHFFIMTSSDNHEDTCTFLSEHNYFGYPKEKIHFYIQSTEPSCDFNGNIFLSEKHRISQSPNGNGGWYSSLIASGFDKILREEKIEWLNVFGVDNVLQKICDPAFIGATYLSNSLCGTKVVKKSYPEEKVGLLCMRNGTPDIVEYSELPEELAKMRTPTGELVYRNGVILNYLFNVDALNRVISLSLPYHLAKKAITHVEDGKVIVPETPNGSKFETLVVDMVKIIGSCLGYEVIREKEFAPVKNKNGVDSVDTARDLLKANGYKI